MNTLLILAVSAEICVFWRDLGISVLGSAIPMIFVAVWGYLKWYKPYSKFKEMGVIKIFKNQQEAESDIIDSINSSNNIKVYAMRGNTFSVKNRQNDIANAATTSTKKNQQYLISDPDNDFIAIRAEEISTSKSEESLKQGIKDSIRQLEIARQANDKIVVRKHKEQIRNRLILLDNYLYLSNLEPGKSSQESPILKIEQNSSFYNAYMKKFDDLWEKYATP